MVENHVELDATFLALADPTRRAMLASLAGGERSVGELAAPHAMSLAGASKHVRMLERAGLVERRKLGRSQLCRLRAGPLKEADRWLKHYERFWLARLDALEALIEAENAARDRGED
ncbi:transcriptional regulator [Sphingomonas sp. DBB INV C78]